MAESRTFGYAHSQAVLSGLMVHAKDKGSYIGRDYGYVDKPGEYEMFEEMLKIARLGMRDVLYVDTVKEFAGHSLADFKAALTAIRDAGMVVHSVTESNYNYDNYMTAIQVLEDLMPAYQKSRQHAAAVTMFRFGVGVEQICRELELSEAEVYEAIASYKRALEEAEDE